MSAGITPLTGQRKKMNATEKQRATMLASHALKCDAICDVVSRDQAIRELANIIGYYQTGRLTTREFRGEAVPPLMLRMPNGARAVPWSRRWKAVEAWAQS